MSWYDTLKERAFKFLFKEEAKKIESLEQKYEELKSDKELSGIYNNLTSDYDILEEKFLETLNELNEYKNINRILTDELNGYREKEISPNEEKGIDDTKERITIKDLNLEDASFIEKGTSFLLKDLKMVNTIFILKRIQIINIIMNLEIIIYLILKSLVIFLRKRGIYLLEKT
ncbi:hypothetical protein [Clostridium paraputrificum]|uniref:hypothetical protein n=1 Tax=Clostridium paraputrificum TaxID=29363 RepID=UPI003F5F941D